jgi:hypothetical protein
LRCFILHPSICVCICVFVFMSDRVTALLYFSEYGLELDCIREAMYAQVRSDGLRLHCQGD